MKTFPKLLVATEFPPNASGGGPAVVRQMLSEWPADRVVWWSCLPERGSFGFPVGLHTVAEIPPRLYPHRRMAGLKGWFLQNIWRRRAAQHLRATLARHRPDAIWTIPHLWSIPPLREVLPAGPESYHVSVHDYPVHHRNDRLGPALRQQLSEALERIYKEANSRDVISPEMAEDMKRRTGCAAEHIFNAGVEPEDFAWLAARPWSSGPIKIAHAGTIVAEETFRRFVESVRKIRESRPLELHLFGNEVYRERPWFAREWMFEHGNIGPEEFRLALQKCDWGVAAMDLTDDNPLYNRISLPSKVIRYLAAGLAVISLGHRDSTLANLASRYAFGIKVDDAAEMETRLHEGLQEPDVWSRYGGEILRCAHENFDAATMRKTLYARLGVND